MATTAKPDISELQFRPGELPPGLTAEQVRSHVIAPTHLRDLESDDDDSAETRHRDVTAALAPPPPGGVAHSNIEAFRTAVHSKLQSSVVGYVFQVRKNGAKVSETVWNSARTPIDGDLGWTDNTRMHVASVSKLLTAVGMVKALDSRGIPYDAPMSGVLPKYWTKGPNIDKITFADLLTHRSGLAAGGSDFALMKAAVAAGVTSIPGSSWNYQNMNYGLCRILIPLVTGMIDKHMTYPDVVWDAVTLQLYKKYMQSNVFSPAGVNNAGWTPTVNGALAYRQPHANLHGWNSGDLGPVVGGVGWRLSIKELLDVMNHVRRKDTIVSPQTAQTILDSSLGVTWFDTPAGKGYGKSGGWGDENAALEQCVAYYLPEGLEAAVFVNSPIRPIAPSNYKLSDVVLEAYLGSLSA